MPFLLSCTRIVVEIVALGLFVGSIALIAA
jgi:hypothetical protein